VPKAGESRGAGDVILVTEMPEKKDESEGDAGDATPIARLIARDLARDVPRAVR